MSERDAEILCMLARLVEAVEGIHACLRAGVHAGSPPSFSSLKSSSRETESKTKKESEAACTRVRAIHDASDPAWVASLKANPAYAGVDIDTQLGRCLAWCETNGKVFSRRRALNWLNRTEKPLTVAPPKRGFAATMQRIRDLEAQRGRPDVS